MDHWFLIFLHNSALTNKWAAKPHILLLELDSGTIGWHMFTPTQAHGFFHHAPSRVQWSAVAWKGADTAAQCSNWKLPLSCFEAVISEGKDGLRYATALSNPVWDSDKYRIPTSLEWKNK